MSAFNKIKKGLSWAFNNSGNAVDRTRLRITDGSALHTTGLQRLSTNWPLLAGLGTSVGLSATLSKTPIEAGMNIAFSSGAAIFAHILNITNMDNSLKKIFRSADSDTCFNTAPQNTTRTLNEMGFAEDVYKGSMASLTIIGVLLPCLYVCKEMPQLFMPLSSLTSVMTTNLICDMTRFKRVMEGEWTIEDAPPPKKKVRAPLLDKLAVLGLRPAPANACSMEIDPL